MAQQRDRLDALLIRWLSDRTEGISAAQLRRISAAWRVLPADDQQLLALHYSGDGTAGEKAAAAGMCRRAYHEKVGLAKHRVFGAMAILAEAAQAA